MSEGHDPKRPVGRGNPPKHTQFKRGQSGNPKGRPKNARNFATLFRDVFEQLASIKVDGKKKEISYSEAVLMKARQMAMNNDSRLLCKLLDLMEKHLKAAESDARLLDQDEERLLARMIGGSASREAASELRHTLTLHDSGFDLETSWMTPDDLAALRAFIEESELYDRYMEGENNALALAAFIVELVQRPIAPVTQRFHERFEAILIKEDGSLVVAGQTGGQS